MLLRTLFICLSILLSSGIATYGQQTLPSPAEYLGYKLGETWTPHHKVVGYFKELADASPMVEWQQYGTTYEGRELILAIVSTAENIARKEDIRLDNLRRAGLAEGEAGSDSTAIVWLSYNVHGNEPSPSEAAMKTLYELVRSDHTGTRDWLEHVVVIIDPMLNPDGHERYVNWYRETVGEDPNIYPDAREHHEPWPGGRNNHYYFDLNRDWIWATQAETRHRLDVFQSWLPQIHVDFHEQAHNIPYYFAPAAEPFHQAITDWQRQFQYTIGRNHARYFDQNKWLYFTRETFDLFYPGYGDTYPLFNGAIGMTYEQAGHGRAGLEILQENGDTLTLEDRIARHFTTGLSTVEVASENASQLVAEFEKYYADAAKNPAGTYKTYVIGAENDPGKLEKLFELLKRHQVQYGMAPNTGTYRGYNYRTGGVERVTVSSDDYIVSAYQPKSVMARIFFEPSPELADSVTYDITAWELHYAFGLEGYALTDRIDPVPADRVSVLPEADNASPEDPYAWLADWHNEADLDLLSTLLGAGIEVHFATREFRTGGAAYEPGTLIIMRTGNDSLGEQMDRYVRTLADDHARQLVPVETGFVDAGPDLGSSRVRYLEKPVVALLSGESVTPESAGEVWHFFDREIDYPVTVLDSRYFGEVDMERFDVLILPDGDYSHIIDEEQLNEILDWIADGGKLIAIQSANRFLADKDGFGLESGKEDSTAVPSLSIVPFSNRQRAGISTTNPGSIFSVSIDNTHPLAFGYGDTYYTMKLDVHAFPYLTDGWNVGVTRESSHMSGFVGSRAKRDLEESLAFGVQEIGLGSVVYLIDDPLFRGFWQNGKLLFGNAVFLVGQ